jgi:hypothetical protein
MGYDIVGYRCFGGPYCPIFRVKMGQYQCTVSTHGSSSLWAPNLESEVSPCEICGGQSCVGAHLSPSTSVLPCHSSTLKMEAARSSEMLVSYYITTRRHVITHKNLHRRGYLQSLICIWYSRRIGRSAKGLRLTPYSLKRANVPVELEGTLWKRLWRA